MLNQGTEAWNDLNLQFKWFNVPEHAYDSLVGEFVWLGINPQTALKFAGMYYPAEEIKFGAEDESFEAYVETVMDLHYYKYDEFGVDETFPDDKDIFEEIRNRGDYTRVRVYIDGANLLRAYAYIQENIVDVGDLVEREVSINIKNYQAPFFNEQYPVWFIVYTLIIATGAERSLLDGITFVMCADTEEAQKLFDRLRHEYAIDVITPGKVGDGYKSSTKEDSTLKELIVSDLNADKFDVAILATGDGNKKDGISFPEIGRLIQQRGNELFFIGLGLTISNEIKNNFDFFDYSHPVFHPRTHDGPEISGLA